MECRCSALDEKLRSGRRHYVTVDDVSGTHWVESWM
jgi:hypothetical protein